MAGGWEQFKLIAIPKDEHNGIGRSVLGYAAESLVIGRALLCGYGLFFKAWRDYKCDAILDHKGKTYRIEIKGTSVGKNLSVSSGGRSGQQISRNAASRDKLVSREDVDFVFGVHTLSGDAWILPIEIVEIFGSKSLNLTKVAAFKESWKIFLLPEVSELGVDGLKTQLLAKTEKELEVILGAIGGSEPSTRMKFDQAVFHNFKSRREALAYGIWEQLGRLGQTT